MKSIERPTMPTYEPHHHTIAEGLGYETKDLLFRPAIGGHMAYKRLIIDVPSTKKTYFVKGQDSSLFTDDEREIHARQYLLKEHMLFNYLRDNGYPFIPEETGLIQGNFLIMQGLNSEKGWHWRAPRDNQELFDAYVQSILESFEALQEVAIPSEEYFFPKRILKVYMQEGWDQLNGDHVDRVRKAAEELRSQLRPQTQLVLSEVMGILPQLVSTGQALYDNAQQYYLCHHDARQANIAWHPEHGTRAIDLSWMDIGFKNADSTMLLIDLAKAGHDISPYMKGYFNPDHALLLMGHWLGRCAEPSKDGNPIVRLHQLASALTAYRLLYIS